jgi:hypothetical protein
MIWWVSFDQFKALRKTVRFLKKKEILLQTDLGLKSATSTLSWASSLL